MKLIQDTAEALRLFEKRRQTDNASLLGDVADILSQVKKGGDAALRALSERFDGVKLERFDVPEAAFAAAEAHVGDELKKAMVLASERIRQFYSRQPKEGFIYQDGSALLGQLVRPLERVACYVPAGQTPLFSTLLMTVIPAQVAGVPEIVVASAPDKRGNLAPEVLVAARMLGVTEIYRLGGPLAIAALAYGTESITRVDKIVGPGSAYTMAAKKLVFGEVGIEALPGPTETLVIADDSASVKHVAADLLAQAEHEAAQPVLVTTSKTLANTIMSVLEQQLETLPLAATARASLSERGYLVLVKTLDEAAEVANAYAPEHLCLVLREPWAMMPKVKHAGGLFIGEHSMEALGDYLAGPSHVMPTGGTARFSSAINLRDFQKVIPFVSMDRASIQTIGQAAASMARAEGLEAHARAIESRLSQD